MACRMAVGLLIKVFLVIAVMAVLYHTAIAMPSGGRTLQLSTDGLNTNDETETPVAQLVTRMKKQDSNVSNKSNGSTKSNGSAKKCFQTMRNWIGNLPKRFSSRHRARSRGIFNTPSQKDLIKSQTLRQKSMERQRTIRNAASASASFNDRTASFNIPEAGDERGIPVRSPGNGSPKAGGMSPRRGGASTSEITSADR